MAAPEHDDSQRPPDPALPRDAEIYDLAPEEPAPAAERPMAQSSRFVPPLTTPKAKIDAPGLTEDFDEDADFTRDPEVERALRGGDKPGREKPGITGGDEATALVRPGLGDARVIATAGACVGLAAVIVAGINAQGAWYIASIATLYMTLLHAATGVLALSITAHIDGQRLGPPELGAARMLLAVASFMLLLKINLPIPGRFEETALAATAYIAAVWLLFRFDQRRMMLVAALHAGMAMAVMVALMLHQWGAGEVVPGAPR